MNQKNKPPHQSKHLRHERESLPLVSGAWLLRWFLIAIGFAALCGYLTICLLFYQGQWQVVFHPSRSLGTTPGTLGIAFDDVRFNYTETGLAQLDGWWIPTDAATTTSPAHPGRTILFFHDGNGSLSNSAGQLKALHSLGVDLFAIDYRGFGSSLNTHPSEQGVYQDADAALTYLVSERHIDPRRIVVDGAGLGATIAAETVRRHPEIAGLILEDPVPPALTLIDRDPRTRLLPVRLLFHDRFELAPRLQNLTTPKLFLLHGASESPTANYFAAASAPKSLITLNGPATRFDLPEYLTRIRDFLDQVCR